MTKKETYYGVELFGIAGLYFRERPEKSEIPSGFFCYDLKGDYYNEMVQVGESVNARYAGSVLLPIPIHLKTGRLSGSPGNWNFPISV